MEFGRRACDDGYLPLQMGTKIVLTLLRVKARIRPPPGAPRDEQRLTDSQDWSSGQAAKVIFR